MKFKSVILSLLIVSQLLLAQEKKTKPKEVIADAFSKLALKALFAIQADNSRAEQDMENVHVEMDIASRPAEAIAFSHLTLYGLNHRGNLLDRESRRSQINAELCNQHKTGCQNPYELEAAVRADKEYSEIVSRDQKCVSSIETMLRKREMAEAPECNKF